MKRFILLPLLFVVCFAQAQIDLHIKMSNGISKFKSYRDRTILDGEKTEHFIYSGGLGAEIYFFSKHQISPTIGLSFLSLGNTDKYSAQHSYAPNTSYQWRLPYLTIPIGVRYQSNKHIGASVGLDIGFLLDDPLHAMASATKMANYDLALKTVVFYQISKWQIGLEYYNGFTDVMGFGVIDEIYDARLFNRALWFTVDYKLLSF